MSTVIFLGATAFLAIGFALLDRWHRRKAWRNAHRWALERTNGLPPSLHGGVRPRAAPPRDATAPSPPAKDD